MLKLIRKVSEMVAIARKRKVIPAITRWLYTAMAVALYGLGAYHYTQPFAAWRSGTIETISATMLLVAAFLVPGLVAVVISFIFAAMMITLGVRHIAIGGGWHSGSVELLFAAILVVNAILINKSRKKHENG